MTATSRSNAGPFVALEREWATVCRRHRSPAAIAGWAEQEPALAGIHRLADLVPPPGVDRAPLCAAVARLHVAGDDLAGRALLQLLIPGMCRLTALWMPRLQGGVTEAAWEVITRAHLYIVRLRERDIRCSPAGYVLRSVHRDLLIEAGHQARAIPVGPISDDDHHGELHPALPSAEEVAWNGSLYWWALQGTLRQGALPPDAVRTVGLLASGYTVEEAAEQTVSSIASAYRHRSRARTLLRERRFAVAS